MDGYSFIKQLIIIIIIIVINRRRRGGTRDLQLNHEKHLYLSAGKYFISKKDRRGYLLRVCKYAKYGVFYGNVFKMTPLRLQGSHFDSQTVAT